MKATTKTIPCNLIHTTWLPDYVVLGNGDYRCYRRLSLNDLMIEDGISTSDDKRFVMNLKLSSLTTVSIIKKLMITAKEGKK